MTGPARRLAFVGFDSAWTDNPKAPGAIAALLVAGDVVEEFRPPRLVRFAEALEAIREIAALADLHPGRAGPADDRRQRVQHAAGRAGGRLADQLDGRGVQPSNRTRKGMFCDASPIWPFLSALGAVEDPLAARSATAGLHLVEVFPALALASLEPAFFARSGAPRYNPGRRTFRPADWERVASVVALHYERLGSCRGLRLVPGGSGPGDAAQG